MKPLSIRLKLTLWYSAVLLSTLILFGFIGFFAMRRGIEGGVDDGLREQQRGVSEVMQRVLPEGRERLRDELRERLQPRGDRDFSQISDETGRWLFQSEAMKRLDIPRKGTSEASYFFIRANGHPFRVLTQQFQVDGQAYLVQVAVPMGDFEDALNRFKWFLILSSPLLLVLASVGGYWMSRRALAPVDEITRAAQEIHSRNLSRRLTVRQSRDELQRLTETLNSMLARLEAAFGKITRFTADASHELRTPIALMRAAAEISLRKSRSEAEYRETLFAILGESEKTTALVEKLMLLARTDAGFESLEQSVVNLNECLADACRKGRTLAEGRRIEFQQQLPTESVHVVGDASALRRLFLILIDNAVKYTPEEGQVAVSLTADSEFAHVEVRDTGIGIGAEDLPHVFERFYRADKARSREQGGAGLGLSIARWIAEAHGGSIRVRSTPGAGSLFQVRLPLSNA